MGSNDLFLELLRPLILKNPTEGYSAGHCVQDVYTQDLLLIFGDRYSEVFCRLESFHVSHQLWLRRWSSSYEAVKVRVSDDVGLPVGHLCPNRQEMSHLRAHHSPVLPQSLFLALSFLVLMHFCSLYI